MVIAVFIGSFILIMFFIYLLYVSMEMEQARTVDTKNLVNKFYRSKVTDKLDELIERMGKHKPNRIILGNYFWKQIPTTYTIKWEKGMGPHGSLRPRKQDTIMYKDVEVVHDKENEYTFDLE